MTDRERTIKAFRTRIISDSEEFNTVEIPVGEAKRILELLEEQEAREQCLKTKCIICPHCDNCDVDENGLLKEQGPIETRLHLCESCTKEYPECDATIGGIEFGCGVGNDNIIGCTAYVNRWKEQQPKTAR